MSNAAYWQKRAAGRMFEYQAEADAVADELSKEYIRASNYITGEAEKVLRSFQGISGISVEEAELLLSDLPDKVTLDNLKAVVDNIPDSKTRHDMLNIINSPAYSYRIRRFEELQREIDVQTQKLAKSEISVTGAHYKALCEEAYLKNIFEVQKGTGIGFSFSKLPKSRIDEIMKQNWSGKLFSQRIWGREGIVNDTLKKELLVGIMSGRSNVKTATAIEEALGASAIDARRLVRTESTYIANAAEMESYKELDIEKYEFMATLDMRTSDVCSALDGKTFPVKDGVPGVNMPPMHPWCRSTTIAVIDGAVTDSLKRRARDPETNELYEVPKDMTYEEWNKTLQDYMASKSGAELGCSKPITHSAEELVEIVQYAKNKGVKIFQVQKFDGDTELLKEQIDVIHSLKNEYNYKGKVTITFGNLGSIDLASTHKNGKIITFNNLALRNRKLTNEYLSADNYLAETDIRGIAAHEMGHVLQIRYGIKGLDIAQKTCYNLNGKSLHHSDVVKYLKNNISRYSSEKDNQYDGKPTKSKHFKEIIPEMIGKHFTNPDEFTTEFIELLKEVWKI